MILEHAVLDVDPARVVEFVAAFDRARPLIAAADGFVSLRLERCLERPGRFVLLVEWESVEAHTEGFRASPAFARWRELLHHFYHPAPTVEHFTLVVQEPERAARAGP